MVVYDYLCRKKNSFNGRLHLVDKVYQFKEDVKVPVHFKKLGVHKQEVSLEAQVSALRKELSKVKTMLKKVTAEKDNLKRFAGGKDEKV
jgi:hypothetical protein